MDRTVDEEADKVAEQFMRQVNGGSRQLEDALLHRVARDHRTLQGYAIRLMVGVMKRIGQDPEWGTDLRNQGAVQWCQALHRLTCANTDAQVIEAAKILRDGFAVW